MAHYAFLDDNNVVTEVITGIDENEYVEGWDPESWYGRQRNQVCKRTSFNTLNNHYWNNETQSWQLEGAFRKNFAQVGYIFDPVNDGFIPNKKPYPSWVLNAEKCSYESPVPHPVMEEDGIPRIWMWNEEEQKWDGPFESDNP